MKHVTMREVAERAGVQPACVSVVLNNAQSNVRVSQEVREKILAASLELGYKRNSSMSSLAKGRFGCVALLLSSDEAYSWLPRQVLQGVYDELGKHNLHLTLFQIPEEDLADEQKAPKILREWVADGILIDYTHKIPVGLQSLIDEPRFPVVWINSKQEFDCVHPDDYAASSQATEDLIAKGHRDIVFIDLDGIACPDESHYSSYDRLEGYKSAMEKAGLTSSTFTPPKKVDFELRAQAVEGFLQSLEKMATAIIASNGEVAMATIWAASKLGYSVPEDLSVVSIGLRFKPFGPHVLTSYEVPHREMGKRATEMLLKKIGKPQLRLPAEIVPFLYVEGNTAAALI